MEIQESWFDFVVQEPVSTAANRYSNDTITRGFNYIVHSNNNHSSAHIAVRYGAGHTSLVKPLIVVEQYNIATVADGALAHCNNANNTVQNFLEKTQPPYTGNFDFNLNLEQAGYDIVYIDFDYNTDYIERNAALFEDVVRLVNTTWKQPLNGVVQRNVVLGMSMGGLIARYGLAEMTKRGNDDPDTRLLVLHDSPQRGAYNPVGTQSLTRSFDVPFLFNLKVRDLKPELGAAVEVLNQPVTQQLSILNAFNGRGGSGIQPNTFLNGPNSPYRQMVETVPGATYAIVATSDGSQCGNPQNTPLGVELAHTKTDFLFPMHGFVVVYPFTLHADMVAYGLPAYGQQAEVSHARIWIAYELCIGAGYFSYCWSIKYHLLDESATSPPNTLPYETLPGGNTNYKQESGNCADLTGVTGFFLNATLYDGDVCFVPTFSALDLPANTPVDAYASYANNITSNSATRTGSPRIDQFIAQEHNGNQFSLTHLRYTARNGEWLFDQMQNKTQAAALVACSSECAVPLSITGPNPLCPNGPTTYSTNAPAGTPVTWVSSDPSVATIDYGTGVAQMVSNGVVTFTAVAHTDCGNVNTGFNAQVGQVPATGSFDTGPDAFLYSSGTTLYSIQFLDANQQVTLQLDQPYAFTFQTNTNGPPSVPITPQGPQRATFTFPGASV
ncbi:MAG: hypothetical protein ACRYFX_03060 [Janthinobacterium lividum]